jgi:hypothetical protein
VSSTLYSQVGGILAFGTHVPGDGEMVQQPNDQED